MVTQKLTDEYPLSYLYRLLDFPLLANKDFIVLGRL